MKRKVLFVVFVMFSVIFSGWSGMDPVMADGFIIIPPPHPRPPRPVTPLAIRYHRVSVTVRDQAVEVNIDQSFYNPNPMELEGEYIFPLPPDASISKFSLYIEGKETEGELLDKEKAARIYEEIVRRMKDPALLEYMGRNMFRARVYPLPAHGERRVKLSYEQVLTLEEGMLELVYPLDTERFSSEPLRDVSVHVDLKASSPLKLIYSPSHEIDVQRKGSSRADVSYEETNVLPDRDFKLIWTVNPDDVDINLLTHKSDGEDGWYLLFITPATELAEEKVIPKDIVLVLDTSGSMAGEKLNQALAALKFCIHNLNPRDRFGLIRFSTEAELFSDSLREMSDENKEKALQFVESMKARGGTNIYEALHSAVELFDNAERPKMIFFLTDGRPTVGKVEIGEILKAVESDLEGKRVFTFGLGFDVNTILLDKLAEESNGDNEYVTPDEDIEIKVSRLYSKVSSPALSDTSLHGLDRIGSYDRYPKKLPDLFKGSQLMAAGRYKNGGHAAVKLQGKLQNTATQYVYEAVFPHRNEDNSFIPHIWASRKIGYLMDQIRLHGENQELKNEIVRLSKKYGVMTPYTSFLVLEDEKRTEAPHPAFEQTLRRDRELDQLQIYGAAPKASGKLAVKQSMEAGRMRQANVSAPGRKQYEETKFIPEIRSVGTRTFYKSDDGVWYQSDYETGTETEKIKFNSNAYFKLLKGESEVGKILALGARIIFEWEDRYIEIIE